MRGGDANGVRSLSEYSTWRRCAAMVSGSEHLDWDLPAPHLAWVAVAPADIDAYEHVNNAVYMTWFDRAAWQHSAALGLPIEKCLQLDRGVAVLRSVIAYLRPPEFRERYVALDEVMRAGAKLAPI